MRIAVADTSALINLTHLNLAWELALFFDTIYVPRAVQEELNRKGRFRYRLKKLYNTGFFARCMAAEEALIQAQEKQALSFISSEIKDALARIAARLGQKAIGTLRLLARLTLEGRAPEYLTCD